MTHRTKGGRGARGHSKMEKVMREFYAGTLRSSSGAPVRNPTQAKAIGLSEQRRVAKQRAKHRH